MDLASILLALTVARAATPSPVVTTCLNAAPGLKERLLEQVSLYGSKRWRIGLAVVSCRKESLLFGYNAATALSPASNQKLLVTACALAHWDDAFARCLDSLLDRNPTRKHRHAFNPAKAESLGMNLHPEFAGYRHLVLANRESDNMEAEWMLQLLAREKRCPPQTLIGMFLDSQSAPRGGLRVWDGCGLSRRNRVSPLTIARLLGRVNDSPHAEIFRSTLAKPGQPGTLIHRNLEVGSRVSGKTGFIRDVFALSGYLSAEEDTFAFSFILNGCGSGARAYTFFNALLNSLYAWDYDIQAGHLTPGDSGSLQN